MLTYLATKSGSRSSCIRTCEDKSADAHAAHSFDPGCTRTSQPFHHEHRQLSCLCLHRLLVLMDGGVEHACAEAGDKRSTKVCEVDFHEIEPSKTPTTRYKTDVYLSMATDGEPYVSRQAVQASKPTDRRATATHRITSRNREDHVPRTRKHSVLPA